MAAKENVTTPMPFPPEIYYKQYTDEKIKREQCPKPPKIPQDTVVIFGQLQVYFQDGGIFIMYFFKFNKKA